MHHRSFKSRGKHHCGSPFQGWNRDSMWRPGGTSGGGTSGGDQKQISFFAGIFILLFALFLISKAWWMLFFIPVIFGSLSHIFKAAYGDTFEDGGEGDERRKRKNDAPYDDDLFYSEDERDSGLHRARPVERKPRTDDPYDGETIIL